MDPIAGMLMQRGDEKIPVAFPESSQFQNAGETWLPTRHPTLGAQGASVAELGQRI
jgi:hypothetical protein